MTGPVDRVPLSRSFLFERLLALFFAVLGSVFLGVIAGYWFLVLEPAWREHAQAHSRAFAQAQGRRIEHLFDSRIRVEYLRASLTMLLDEILSQEHESTDADMIRRIELEPNYGILQVPAGSVDLARGSDPCARCTPIRIPLYRPEDHVFVGTAVFYCAPEFLQQFSHDVRSKLLWGSVLILSLILLVWRGADRMLRRLGDSESKLRSVFEAAPFPIILQEREKNGIVQFNHAAREYLHLSPDVNVGYSSSSWRQLEQIAWPEEPGEPRQVRLQCEDGNPRWALVSVVPVQYPDFAGRLISIVDISEMKAIQEELRSASFTDSLTGLFNRRYLFIKLSRETELHGRYDHPFSIFMFDIDNFKHVNDTYGHRVGDDVLVGLANVMRYSLREVDIPGRYGGEEFLIILPHARLSDAGEVAERMRLEIGNLRWPQQDLRITISGGVCEYEGQDVDRFVDLADQKLYQAKQQGKNRIVH